MSAFDIAERLMSQTLGTIFHERVRITPLRGKKLIISPDPDRPSFEIAGSLDISTKAKRPIGEGNTSGDVGIIMGTDVKLSIETDTLGARKIREGDRVTALDRPGQPTYLVGKKSPLGIAEIEYDLLPESLV